MTLPRPGPVILTAVYSGVLVALSASTFRDVGENQRRRGVQLVDRFTVNLVSKEPEPGQRLLCAMRSPRQLHGADVGRLNPARRRSEISSGLITKPNRARRRRVVVNKRGNLQGFRVQANASAGDLRNAVRRNARGIESLRYHVNVPLGQVIRERITVTDKRLTPSLR